jgi:hypothetical protein
MKRLAMGLLAAVLALGLLVVSPQRAEATVFGCAYEQQRVYDRWTTRVHICAEHLGSGHYRSRVLAYTIDHNSGASVRANYRFNGQRLYYYCNTGTCRTYDYVNNDGFVGVFDAYSFGNKVGCPGASNRGEVALSSLEVRYPNGVLITFLYWESATNIPFNSRC